MIVGRDDGCEGRAACVPIPLRPRAAQPFVVRALSPTTAAQIVQGYGGEVIYQVNDLIVTSEHQAVALHCHAQHRRRCGTRNCAEARAWLAQGATAEAPAAASA